MRSFAFVRTPSVHAPVTGCRFRVTILVVLLLCLVGLDAAADAGRNHADVADDGLQAAWLLPSGEWAQFDPDRLSRVPRTGDCSAGAVARLWPRSGQWPASPRVLMVRQPVLERIRLEFPDGSASRSAGLMQLPRGQWRGHGRIGFAIQTFPADGAPLDLHFLPQSGIGGNVQFALLDEARFAREDAAWLSFASACFAIMAAMALMALFFAGKLRDLGFVLYAGYILSYALIQLIQTGFAVHPLEWSAIAEAPRQWGRAATVVSVMLAVAFIIHFASLRRYAPRWATGLTWLALAVGLSALFSYLPSDTLRAISRESINPLLMLGGPALLASGLIAWWRGSRYAGFFLVGWTPLLALTVLDSTQLYGVASGWTWVGAAALAAATYESLVLSLGLADKTLTLRKERDRAHDMAHSDALTSLLNRRGLERGLSAVLLRCERRRRPLSILFLDLDGFKQLNDELGHAQGDQALVAVAGRMRQETRARDLVGRYGGEEFLIALPDCGQSRALRIAERLRAGIAGLNIAAGSAGQRLTVSIGLALQMPGDTPSSLIDRADRAMYAAKQAGRNQVQVFRDAALG